MPESSRRVTGVETNMVRKFEYESVEKAEKKAIALMKEGYFTTISYKGKKNPITKNIMKKNVVTAWE